MSAINIAIQEVINEVPRRILELTFRQQRYFSRQAPSSIEEQILAKVVRPRVLVDCNLIGGEEALIDLLRAERVDIDPYSTVYRIPKSLTGGRAIIQAKSVSFLNPDTMNNLGINATCGRSGVLLGINAVLNAQADIPFVGTHYVSLVGENTILIRGGSLLPTSSVLRCTLEYDKNLSALSPRSYPAFSKAVVLATKAYIYRELIIELGEGELQGGVALGAVLSIVESYADANELYQEHREQVLAKVLYMQDDGRMTRHIKLMMGGYR